MNDRKNNLTDKVNVTMHSVQKTNTTKDYSFVRVKRNTAYIGNILDKVLKTEKNLTRATLLYATEVLRDGVVDLFELGILYIKPVSSMETLTPDVNDVPSMTAAFTPSELTVEAVKCVTVGEDVTKSTEPEILSILDMKTESEGAKISGGGTVKIIGKRLKVDGDRTSDVGVFFAPCNETGSYKEEIAEWICIPKGALGFGNTPGTLLFNVPDSLVAGTYRLIVRTAYGSSGRINKVIREGIFSEIVTVV